jgi:hypothetical protein
MKKIILYAIGVLVLVGVLYYIFAPSVWPRYVAVYTTTGDVYYGALSRFPRTNLRDAWYLQRGDSGTLSILQLSKVVWEPKGDLYFNDSQIVWVAPLKKGTQLYAALVSGAFLGQQGGYTNVQPVPTPIASEQAFPPFIFNDSGATSTP